MSGTETRVYEYGLRSPTVGADLVGQQMRLRHDYQNALIESEIQRRDDMRALDSLFGTRELEIAEQEAKAEVDRLIAEAKAERARTRSRKDSTETRQRLQLAKAARRDARSRLSRARRDAKADPRHAAERDRINAAVATRRRALRGEFSSRGLYWGTYQLAESAVEAARSKLPLYDGCQSNNPRFRRWDGSGSVSCQMVAGMFWSDLGSHTQVQLVARDDQRADSVRRQTRPRFTLRLRVGSDEKRRPVFAEWPLILHRPLPDGARIQRVTVHRRMVACHEKWVAQMTIRAAEPVERDDGSVVAIDLGWRAMPDGSYRVGYCWDGIRSTEIMVPPRLVRRFRKVADLRSIRDKNLDACKAELCDWIKSRDIPEWLAEAAAHLHQWRSPARMAALAIAWRQHRFRGDAELFDMVEAWRKQDKHLWTWERAQHASAIRARREVYRVAASKLAARCSTCVVEDDGLGRSATGMMRIDDLARTPEPGDERDAALAGGQRFVAAPGEFRLILRNAFEREGGRIETAAVAHSTTECHVCGDLLGERVDRSSLVLECPNGHRWDQDENAARVLWARSREKLGGDDSPGGARKPEAPAASETPRQRSRRMAAERRDRLGRSKDSAEVVG